MMHDTVVTDATEQIRRVVADFGNLSVPIERLRDDDDLFVAGMDSHASVNVMLALEGAFRIEFPDAMLRRSTFQSITAIHRNVAHLVGERRP